MISPQAIVLIAADIALVVLAAAFLLGAWRVVFGPTLADRVLALDTLSGTAIGFIAVIAVKTGFSLYIDIAISLGLVGFLATVAFARFVMSRGAIATGVGKTLPVASKKPKAARKSSGKQAARKGKR